MLAGLDIGTTGCKATVYDDEGNFLFRGYREYSVARTAEEHEINAGIVWESVKEILGEMGERFPDIQAMGITSFGETCVMLDENACPVCPSMLYTDPRGIEECRELESKIGKSRMEYITGLNPHSMYSLPKIMWIKKHRPEQYRRTKHIFMMEDYIIYMLTGEKVIDYSLATRSMGFDIRKMKWSNEIFQAAEVDTELLATPVIGGTIAGTLRKEVAEMTGLSSEMMILPAGHDQMAAAVGAGIFDRKMAVNGAGTVECITPVYDKIPEGKEMYEGSYAVVPYIVPGKYITYAFSFTGGALLSWYIQNLAKEEKKAAQKCGISVYKVLEERMKDEPTGILVLPYLAGAATPYMDEGAKGAIVGLTMEHTAADLYRAMMEGVAYEMCLNIEQLKKTGICPERLRAAGGGTASEMWMQMKADILNLPISVLESQEVGATGCAMMAGIAAGVYQDLNEAANVFIREKKTYYPRKKKYVAYEKYYQKYRRLYKAVRPFM